jgi:hypothetical protein
VRGEEEWERIDVEGEGEGGEKREREKRGGRNYPISS